MPLSLSLYNPLLWTSDKEFESSSIQSVLHSFDRVDLEQTVTEGDSINYTVTRPEDSQYTRVKIQLMLDGDAEVDDYKISGADLTENLELTLEPGQTSADFTIEVYQDQKTEPIDYIMLWTSGTSEYDSFKLEGVTVSEIKNSPTEGELVKSDDNEWFYVANKSLGVLGADSFTIRDGDIEKEFILELDDNFTPESFTVNTVDKLGGDITWYQSTWVENAVSIDNNTLHGLSDIRIALQDKAPTLPEELSFLAFQINGEDQDIAYTLVETGSNTGVFKSTIEMQGLDKLNVVYYDYIDANSEEAQNENSITPSSSTGYVAFDRTVYPVPFVEDEYYQEYLPVLLKFIFVLLMLTSINH